MKRRNAQILSILLSLCVLGTSPVYAEDFSSDMITTEAESQNMASDEATSEAEFSVEEDENPATNGNLNGNPVTNADPATNADPETDTDVTLEEEEPGNQEEANSDEFVDDQEEAFSDGDSETEFDEVEEEVQNEAGALTENEADAVGSGTLLEAGAVALFLLFFLCAADIPKVYRYSCYYWLPVSLIILIFALQQGGISRLLSNRFLIIGGEISYSFYLIHLFIIDAYMRMSAHYHWQIQWTISVPVILCITIILSLLSFYYFEKPANKWVKRIFTKKTIINQPHGIINKNTPN